MAELQSLGLVASAEDPQPRELAYPDLGELTYLQAVIKVHKTSRHCQSCLICALESLLRVEWRQSAGPVSQCAVRCLQSTQIDAELCWQETLRMYPPVGIGQARVCASHDTIVGGHLHLPASTFIAMPHHTIHNASFNWDLPDKFMPGEQRSSALKPSLKPTTYASAAKGRDQFKS